MTDQEAGGRPNKRQKKMLNSLIDNQPGAQDITSLIRTDINLQRSITPGALHSSRISILDFQSDNDTEYRTFIASGKQVFSVIAPRPAAGAHPIAKGKEGVVMPRLITGTTTKLIEQITHRAEIQHLNLVQSTDNNNVLAAVDCYGRATIAHLSSSADNDDDASSNSCTIRQVVSITPENTLIEAGWAGISLATDQPTQAAIARHFAKDVTVFDGQMAVRSINTLYRPTAVQLLASDFSQPSGGVNSPLVAIAEGPQVSVWDVRAAGRGGRIARLLPGGPHGGHLYCLAASNTNSSMPVIGSAGADRNVSVWDPRRWVVLDRWNNCLKYEATALYFSSTDPGRCITCGMDYEVICGRWDGDRRNRLGGGHRTGKKAQKHESDGGAIGADTTTAAASSVPSNTDKNSNANSSVSFRGDSRWLGLTKMQGRDVVAGWTASGQLYVSEFSSLI